MSPCEHPEKPHRGNSARYIVEYPEGRLSVVVCRKHAQPLLQFSKSLGRKPQKPAKVDRKAATRPIDLDML